MPLAFFQNGGSVACSGNLRGQGMMCMGVRILNAAHFVGAVKVLIGNRELARGLCYGQVSDYTKVGAGFRSVSVISEETGEELLCETMPFYGGRRMVLVLYNTMNGMILIPMEECICGEGRERACLRAANFSYGEEFDLALADGERVFSNLMQGRVTSFLPALPGEYDFSICKSAKMQEEKLTEEKCINLNIVSGVSYTICILGSGNKETPFTIKVLEF